MGSDHNIYLLMNVMTRQHCCRR